jgi:hypothetical protein
LARTGQKHTEGRTTNERLASLLRIAWKSGFTVASDLARSNAGLVAMAASLQLISTRVTKDVYSRNWQITNKGLRWLREQEELA